MNTTHSACIFLLNFGFLEAEGHKFKPGTSNFMCEIVFVIYCDRFDEGKHQEADCKDL